jgi:Acetyltransferase (GNAT) family
VTISAGAVELRRMMLDDPSIDIDVRRVDQILMRAYGSESMRARVLRFLSIPTGRWVVAEHGEEMLAAGGCIGYPSGGFGWIGLIATDPHKSRDGIGTAVTQWLIERVEHGRAADVPQLLGSAMMNFRRLAFRASHRAVTNSMCEMSVPRSCRAWPELFHASTIVFCSICHATQNTSKLRNEFAFVANGLSRCESSRS